MNDLEKNKIDLEKAKIELENRKLLLQEKSQSDERTIKTEELSLKVKELELKKIEYSKSILRNPLFLGITAATLSLIGNLIATVYNGQLERVKLDSQNILENQKAQTSFILETVKTGDPDSAATNLQFLLEAGLIEDKNGKLNSYLNDREDGTGFFLPDGGMQSQKDDTKATSYLFSVGQSIGYAFMQTPTAMQREVVELAIAEWGKYANLKFAPVSLDKSSIRISFDKGLGYWSAHGNDVEYVADGEPFYPKDVATMNIDFESDDEDNALDNVLHLFGHAIGFVEEQQNPNNGIKWNEAAVHAHYSLAPYYWDKATIVERVIGKYKDFMYPCDRDYDPNSIMMSSIPEGLTADGKAISPESGLSSSDIECAKNLYPFPKKFAGRKTQ